ncbi:Sterol 3-beta-glucosyltransferase UGT80A2, partial [Mucuna pruriens]
MKIRREEPMEILVDNKLAISLAKHLVGHGRRKVELKYCITNEQVVDILTKPLKSDQFKMIRDMIGVHHGGAGTTAAGLKAACPTTIVPFFGDQPFWGERVHARGVGPPPILVDEFSLPKLVDAINFMLDPKVKERAIELAKSMESEDGVKGAVNAFFKQLPQKKPEPDAEPQPSSFFSMVKWAVECFGPDGEVGCGMFWPPCKTHNINRIRARLLPSPLNEDDKLASTEIDNGFLYGVY